MSGRTPDDVVSKDVVVVGRISGLFGVKGWVKLYSYTRPRDAILNYKTWRLRLQHSWREVELAEGRRQGAGVVGRLQGIENRDAASALIGADIAVPRSALASLKRGEYYWADLEGLEVVNLEGEELGTVSHLIETGANDVLVVVGERERLIPFTKDAIKQVDLASGIIRVDWDADF